MALSRKLLIRVIGAPLLVAALVGLMAWGHHLERQGRPNTPLHVLILLVGLLSLHEVYGMGEVKGIRSASRAGLVALALLLLPWHLVPLPDALLLTYVPLLLQWIWPLFILYVLFKLVFRYGTFTPEGGAFTLLGFAYIGLIKYLQESPRPEAYFLLFLLAAGKGSDMAAFVVGKAMGKHRMSPVVSPNKTWEGGIAGGIAGTGAGLAILLLTPLREAYAGVPAAALLFLSILVTIAAQVGDLVKSALKRWAGVKDSGRLLPEFGGMVDMVDSFLVCAPVALLGTDLLRRIFIEAP